MIRLRVLGALELRNEAGQDVASVLSQPRRVALLAYLALRAPRGPERRDTLLALFWPESDGHRARAALRNAIHFLRRSLGAAALESVSDEDLRIDPDRVWCDAVAFERLLDEGRPEEALELYRGDLLEGFFGGDAPGFEDWLATERSRLRVRAVEAASALRDRAEAEGRAALAVHHARHALTLSGDDEGAARRLVELLWKGGDRSGARRAHAAFVAHLRRAYEMEPSPRTRGLLVALEAEEADEPVSTAIPPAALAAGEASAAEPPRSRGRPAAARPWQWPALLALAGVVGVAVAASAAGLLRPQSRDAEAERASPDLVAVLPFSYRGDEELGFLGEGMAVLLSANLDGAGELRALDPRRFLGESSGSGNGGDSTARAAALRLGAGSLVRGDVVEMAGRLRVSAALYSGHEGSGLPVTTATVEGATSDLFDLADALTTRLLEERSGGDLARTALRTTHSMEALKAYLRGEASYRSGRYGAAVEEFRRAGEIDPAFRLAHYRLSMAATWVGRSEQAKEAAVRALASPGALSRPDSLLMTGWLHHLRSRVDLAEPLYRHVVALDPNHVDAWLQLGELLFHWGPTLGRPSAESRTAFERVLSLEPEHSSAAIHLARIAAQERAVDELDAVVERLLARDPGGPWSLEMRTLRALASGGPQARDRALQRAGEADERVGIALLESVGAWSQDLPVAAELARRLDAPGRSDAGRAEARLMAAHVETARGRWRVAERQLEGPGPLSSARALEVRGMVATLPFLPISDARLADVRAALRSAAGMSSPLPPPDDPIWRGRAEYPPLLWDGIFEPRRLYLEASLSARLGDADAALGAAEALDRAGVAGEAAGPYLARIVRARVAWLRGNGAAALEILGPPGPSPSGTYETVLDYPRAFERYFRAELAEALGRPREALRWYATFPSPTAHDLPLLAPAHLARARIHDGLGETLEAARCYRRFVELWMQADPELQPEVTRARARLDALERAGR